MSGIDASVRGGLGQGEADWPKLWVPPFFKHPRVYMTVIKRNRGGEEAGEEKKEEGKKKADC